MYEKLLNATENVGKAEILKAEVLVKHLAGILRGFKSNFKLFSPVEKVY